ncbi:MAG: hypothetical protein LBM41_00925 [Ruminococcus sp.]|jgi:hypothetical protein|nr:hypothetical protein [Ruminococcus sp.]
MNVVLDMFIIDTCLRRYQDALTDIKLFDTKFPDNVDGHNFLVEVAQRALTHLQILKKCNVEPLPPLK